MNKQAMNSTNAKNELRLWWPDSQKKFRQMRAHGVTNNTGNGFWRNSWIGIGAKIRPRIGKGTDWQSSTTRTCWKSARAWRG